MRKFSFVLSFIFLIGCAPLKTTYQQQRSLIGSWHYKDLSNGRLTLSFFKDQTFIVDGDADGVKDIWGQYQVIGNKIKFTDELARIATMCYEPGYHVYDIEDNQLSFILFADQCLPRKAVLSQTFIRGGYGK